MKTIMPTTVVLQVKSFYATKGAADCQGDFSTVNAATVREFVHRFQIRREERTTAQRRRAPNNAFVFELLISKIE
jgi:hypothetical protein